LRLYFSVWREDAELTLNRKAAKEQKARLAVDTSRLLFSVKKLRRKMIELAWLKLKVAAQQRLARSARFTVASSACAEKLRFREGLSLAKYFRRLRSAVDASQRVETSRRQTIHICYRLSMRFDKLKVILNLAA
jgi:hypothetical protein